MLIDRLWHLVSAPEPPIPPPPADPGISLESAKAVDRAHRVVDRWDAATAMQRALIWERSFWERHQQQEDG